MLNTWRMGALCTLMLFICIFILNPTTELVRAEEATETFVARMELLNKHYSPDKKTILFIHGAKDNNPLKTVEGIRKLTQNQFNVFLYRYNYQIPFTSLVKELKTLWQSTRDQYSIRNENIYVLPFSYGTAIFRATAIDLANKNLFKSVYMIQLAPVGGGAMDAERWSHPYFNISLLEIIDQKMRLHLGDINVGKALSPYGEIQKLLYSDEIKNRFTQIIRGSFSIIASNDTVTMQNSTNPMIRSMYLNGLGNYFEMIPSNHGDLPNTPAALKKIAQILGISKDKQQRLSLL